MHIHLHPHLTALDTLVSAIEDQTGAQQVRLGFHTLAFSMQASVRKQQSSSVPPVVTIRLLAQSTLCVQGWVAAPVPVEGQRRRAPVHLHAGVEARRHQRPQPRPWPRVAAPGIWPEGDGEGLRLIHQRRQGFLRINWRGEQRPDEILMIEAGDCRTPQDPTGLKESCNVLLENSQMMMGKPEIIDLRGQSAH